MMQFKPLLFILFLACVHTATFGQIQKGNYNFGGDVALSTTSMSSNSFKEKTVNLSLSPSFGKFLTNEWLVSVQPLLSTKTQNANVSDLSGNGPYEYKQGQTNLGLGISSRYYVKMSDKISLFGAVNGSFTRQLSSVFITGVNANNFDRKTMANLVTYGVGVGVNIAVKPDVFFETTLSYNGSELIRTDGFGRNKFNFLSFNCGLNHFIINPRKADFASDFAFIKKGRQMFGGGLTVNKFPDYFVSTINPKLSQFVTNRLLLSGEMAIKTFNGDGIDIQIITATAAARYYLPVQKRFFVYPELSYTRKYDDNASNSFFNNRYNKDEVAMGIGGNYFLSKNVALEANFLQARFNVSAEKSTGQYNSLGLVGLNNIGLVYFIR